jgi:type II secretion system protein C
LHIHKVLFAFKITLVLVLSMVIIKTVIMLQKPTEIFQPSSAIGNENTGAGGVVNLVEVSDEDYSDLIDQNIFGVTDVSGAESKSSKVKEISDVVVMAGEELNLELIGTVCGNTMVSRAIIKNTKDKKLGMYRTGQIITGARIENIEENAVILLHNGQRKILTLNRAGGNGSKVRLLSPSVRSKAGRVSSSAIPTNQSFGEVSTKIVYIESILNQATIEPYVVDDQVDGLKITNLDKVPIAKTFGLREGDIIREVNGHRLTGKQQAFQVFKKARSDASLTFELLSDGQTRTLSFNLR